MSMTTGTMIGRYTVGSLLGAGGIGEVYRATTPASGATWRMKVLPATSPGRGRRHRFEQEARTAGALNHPELLTIFDAGTAEGRPYMVTELLDGRRCAAPRDRGGALRKASIRHPDRQRPRRRARAGDRAPRHQAGEPVRHRRRAGEDPRLRPGQASPLATDQRSPTRPWTGTLPGTVMEPSATWRPSRCAGSPSINARTSSPSARPLRDARRPGSVRPGYSRRRDHRDPERAATGHRR